MNDVTFYNCGLAKLNLKAYREAIRDFNESLGWVIQLLQFLGLAKKVVLPPQEKSK